MTWFGKLRMITCHIFPIVTSTTNMILSDVQFLEKDWKKVIIFFLCYICTNIFGWWFTGHPWESPMIDWGDHPGKSARLAAIMVVSAVAMYFLTCKLIKWFLPR